MRYIFAILLVLNANILWAHEMTPTYPVLEPSHVDGVYVAKLSVLNLREEIEYYEITVFNENWEHLPFASQNRVFKLNYLGKIDLSIYIKEKDKDRVKYICTESKLTKSNKTYTAIASRICSKIK